MRFFIILSIGPYLYSLLPFVRAINSSYRYADYCYEMDIFIDGYDYAPCLVVPDWGVMEISIYYILAFFVIMLPYFAWKIIVKNLYDIKEKLLLLFCIMAAFLWTILLLYFISSRITALCLAYEGGICLFGVLNFVIIYSIIYFSSLIFTYFILRRRKKL